MRAAVPVVSSILALSLVFSISCGYVGPIVPPSPMVPLPVTDLAVVERGDRLLISFTTPGVTADALVVDRLSDIDLRLGRDLEPFDLAGWESSAQRFEIPPTPATGEEEARPVPIKKSLPASEWEGRKIAVAVRTAVKGEKHFSQWSNLVVLDVLPPLHPPVIAIVPTGLGYRLTWQPERPGLHFQVLRSSPTDKAPVAIGVAEKPDYIDSTSQFDTPYVYRVIAQDGPSVESLPSAPVPVNEPDKFPPAVPTDINVLAGPDSVEVSWTRSPEPDVKGYLVYRSVDNGPFAVVGALTALPTFSDRKAEHGRTYRYSISAVDNSNNESDKSKPVEVTY